MTYRTIGTVAVGLMLGCLAACDTGAVPGGGNGGPQRIPSDDPSVDSRLDALGIVCESSLLVSGTYTQTEAPPAGHNGCWAVGTWTLTVSLDHQGCDPQPEIATEFTYDVSRDEDANTNVIFVNDPSDDRVNLKITTNGDGLCHGAFDHYGTDFGVLAFRPTLTEAGTLEGFGTYDLFEQDPF
jgi:hypothetical protein